MSGNDALDALNQAVAALTTRERERWSAERANRPQSTDPEATPKAEAPEPEPSTEPTEEAAATGRPATASDNGARPPDPTAAEPPGGDPDHSRANGTATLQHPPDLALEPRILDVFAEAVASTGVVGERHIIQLIFLAVVSRLLERPVNLALKGPSSGGKSYLLATVLSYFPPEAYHALSGMSPHALIYDDTPLRHRMLIVYEAAGIAGDVASYFIRTLLSEGHLHYTTVEKTSEGFRPRTIRRPGPTGLITTTTAINLHPENETRLISATVSDTPEQTRAILLAQAGGARRAHTDPWHHLNAWIQAANRSVTIPYAAALATQIPPVAVRLRRDFPAILSLIASHALVQQASRERDDHGAVIATLDDYAVVREIAMAFISEAVGRSVPLSVRQTVDAVQRLIAQAGPDAEVSVTQLAAALKLDKSSASRRYRHAADRGYLRNLEDKRGMPARIALGDPLPEDTDLLPTVAVLQRATEGFSRPSDGSASEGDVPRVGLSVVAVADARLNGDRPAEADDDPPHDAADDDAAVISVADVADVAVAQASGLGLLRVCPACHHPHAVGTTCRQCPVCREATTPIAVVSP